MCLNYRQIKIQLVLSGHSRRSTSWCQHFSHQHCQRFVFSYWSPWDSTHAKIEIFRQRRSHHWILDKLDAGMGQSKTLLKMFNPWSVWHGGWLQSTHFIMARCLLSRQPSKPNLLLSRLQFQVDRCQRDHPTLPWSSWYVAIPLSALFEKIWNV